MDSASQGPNAAAEPAHELFRRLRHRNERRARIAGLLGARRQASASPPVAGPGEASELDGLQSELRGALRYWRHHMAQGSELVQEVDPPHDHVRGDVDAPVVLVEYGSLGAPAASFEHRAVREKLRSWLDGGQVCHVFRHFPLIDSHPNSWLAARALEAADCQGRFWEMHDALTDLLTAPWATELEPRALRREADRLKLDPDRFEADMERTSLSNRILGDVCSGIGSGVNGAPSFYVQGVRQDIDDAGELMKRVESALAGDIAALWPPRHTAAAT